MKNKTVRVFLAFISIYILGCKEAQNNQALQPETKTTTTQTDTTRSYYFIKDLLNCSPVEVNKILGVPDNFISAPNSITHEREATYQNKKYTVGYYNDMLKFIEITHNFDKNALQEIGLKNCKPTLINETDDSYSLIISWQSKEGLKDATSYITKNAKGPLVAIPGIKSINVFLPSADNNNQGYVTIFVDKSFNKKF